MKDTYLSRGKFVPVPKLAVLGGKGIYMTNILKVENLTKVYGQGEASVRALKQVNVAFESNKITVIVGTSGSGKSTLLNLIGGLDKNATGSVLLGENDLLKMGDSELARIRTRKIGFVFQFFKLIPELTAKENIILPAMIDKRKPDDTSLSELTDKLKISDRLSHYPSQLSGGQQQRVAIARALINDPDILLCDEPTGNLDVASGKEVMELLIDSCRQMGKTVIIVTHDANIAKKADRIIRIEDGSIISDTVNE